MAGVLDLLLLAEVGVLDEDVEIGFVVVPD